MNRGLLASDSGLLKNVLICQGPFLKARQWLEALNNRVQRGDTASLCRPVDLVHLPVHYSMKCPDIFWNREGRVVEALDL